VLDAADAALWLDPGISPEQALELARQAALPPEAFEWFKVTPEVNRANADSPAMALPMPE
jgi:putative SOS response-associated peptidase YedK